MKITIDKFGKRAGDSDQALDEIWNIIPFEELKGRIILDAFVEINGKVSFILTDHTYKDAR